MLGEMGTSLAQIWHATDGLNSERQSLTGSRSFDDVAGALISD